MNNVLKALDEGLGNLYNNKKFLEDANGSLEEQVGILRDELFRARKDLHSIRSLLAKLHSKDMFSLKKFSDELGYSENVFLNPYMNGYDDVLKEFV